MNLILLGLLSLNSAFSQELQFENFAGVVQYVQGTPTKNSEPLGFKSVIKVGDKIQVPKNSLVKIITAQRCIIVAYGTSSLTPPNEAYSNEWQFSGSAFRVNCLDEFEILFRLGKSKIQINGGEMLFANNQLLVLTDDVYVDRDQLSKNTIFSTDDVTWVYENKDEEKIYALNSTWPAPKESTSLKKPEDHSDNLILSLTHFEGTGKMSHSESKFDLDDFAPSGERLSFLYKKKSGGLIGSILFASNENQNNCNGNCYNSNRPNQFNKIETVGAELGWRSNYDSSFSWYYKFGIGETKYKIQSHFNCQSFGSFCTNYNRTESYIAASASLGVDYIWRFSFIKWLGLYFAADLQFLQTISHTNTDLRSCGGQSCENPDSDLSTNGNFSTTGFSIVFGPVLRF